MKIIQSFFVVLLCVSVTISLPLAIGTGFNSALKQPERFPTSSLSNQF